MKKLFWLLLFCLQIISCNDSVSPDEKDSDLEEIYGKNSFSLFDQYIFRWDLESVPVNDSEILSFSDTIRYIYEIYEDFYNPFNLNRYGKDGSYEPETGNDFYSSLKNVIVQNKIAYTFNDYYEGKSEIINFRPRVTFPGRNILYLTEDYSNDFSNFLDDEKPDLQERYNFINERFKIVRGHWFGWHYLTHPEVFTIDFNNNLDTATVHFRIRYEGGEAVYIRKEGGWNLNSSKLTWIE